VALDGAAWLEAIHPRLLKLLASCWRENVTQGKLVIDF
jgi:hypothetical protein